MAEEQFIVFALATERYGVSVQQIQSIERLLPITRVPKTLPFIKGVINLRGVVTPVIDLRERFGLPTEALGDDSRIIVTSVETFTVGLIVDAVIDVQNVDDDAIDPPPNVVGGVQATYLNGIAQLDGNLLILLNLDKIFSDAESSQLKEVEKSVHG